MFKMKNLQEISKMSLFNTTAVSTGKTIRVQTSEGLQILSGHVDFVWSLRFIDEHRLLSSSVDGTLRIWNITNGSCIVLSGHRGWVWSVDVLDNVIVSGSVDSTLKFWTLTGDCIRTVELKESVLSVKSSAKTVVCGLSNKTVVIIDVESGELTKTLCGHTYPVHSVDVSPDGTIASGSYDKTVRVWSPLGEGLAVLVGHEAYVTCVRFSEDGRLIVSGSGDSTVRLWRPSGLCLLVISGHSDWVRSVVFASNTIVSCSRDRTLKRWNLDGELIEETSLDGPGLALAVHV
jgi:WD40 repeat protein